MPTYREMRNCSYNLAIARNSFRFAISPRCANAHTFLFRSALAFLLACTNGPEIPTITFRQAQQSNQKER